MDIETDNVVDEGQPSAESKTQEQITETPPEPEVKAEPPKEEEPSIPKGVQKRIDRAVRQKYEAEAEAKILRERLQSFEQRQFQQPQQQGVDNNEPKIENYSDFDSYVAAKAKWIASQEVERTLSEYDKRQMAERAATAHHKTVESWNRRMAEATAEMPDFEEVLSSSDVPMTDPMKHAIMESEVGPKLAYWLANNQAEALKIAEMSPIGAIRAIGRIEERLTGQNSVKKPTSAPKPLTPVGGKAAVSKDPGQMSDEEYAKWRRQGKA
jgi:hypothetical protein